MRTFNYTGVWWLPGSDTHVAGTLTYDGSEYPRLKLIGLLHELRDLNNATLPSNFILGVAGGKNITLAKAMLAGTQVSAPGIPTSEVAAPIVILGAHIEREEDLLFTNMAISYDHLIEWSGFSAISQTSAAATEDEGPSVTIKAAAEKYPVFPVAGVQGRFAVTWSTTSDGVYAAGFVQDFSIQITPTQPASLDEYLSRYFYHIQNFITLGVGEPIGVRRASALVAGEGRTEQVELVFSTRPGSVKSINRWDMLFTRPDLGDEWYRALDRWIERAEVLGPVYDLFFSTLYGSKMYLQHEFLSLTQALESYHRRTDDSVYLPENVFADLRATLESALNADSRLNSDVKRALAGRLRYFNEFSQRRRFKDVLRRLGELAELLIQDVAGFVDSVVNTRNYLTHYDPDAKPLAADNEDLWRLSEQLRFVLEVCLLQELGIDRPTIAALIKRHQRYSYLRSELRRATESRS